jgi:hypothetical protein
VKKQERIAVIVLLLFAHSLFAHDMYLRPHVEKNDKEVSLAMVLVKEEVVWFESMTAGLRMDGPTGEVNLNVPEKGDPSVEFEHPGTYVIGWQSEPIFINIEPDIFKKYIAFEEYPQIAQVRKERNQDNQPGREFYTRFIKTYIQVGTNLTKDFNRPFGYKIELIPKQNPCGLRVDSELDVLLLYDGKPLPNRKIMATYESYSDLPEDYAQTTRTDENGIAKFRITHKGLWLVRANQIIPVVNNPEADWQSFWANFTFEVK